MAIIKCPECQQDVSENAVMCPHCGYGVKNHFDSIKQIETQNELTEKNASNVLKRKKLFKIWVPICAIVICMLLATLCFLTSYCGKTTKHCGIYDTKTKSYIDIGDSQEDVEKIVGPATKKDSGSYDYADNLTIRYDENNNVESIRVNYFSFHGDLSRYTLFDGCGNDSTETDFINKHSHIYKTDLDTVIFLRKTFTGYKESTKEKIDDLIKNLDYAIRESKSYIEVRFDTLGINVDLLSFPTSALPGFWDASYTEIHR